MFIELDRKIPVYAVMTSFFVGIMSLLFIFFASFSTNALAKTPNSPQLTKRINAVLANFNEDVNIGIVVQNSKTEQVLYQKHADRHFTPASNQKLFTAFAALRYLGRDFKYQTQFFADLSKRQNNVLNDHVYLKFSGDPLLTLSQLDNLMGALTRAGIQTINGKFIIDDTAFDAITMSPGSAWDDENYCFGAPVSALIVDHNCASAKLIPAKRLGELVELEFTEQPQFIKFINHITTAAADTKDCTVDVRRINHTTYSLSGCIKADSIDETVDVAVAQPRIFMNTVITYLLNKNHITVRQGLEYGKVNSSLPPLAIQESPPLSALIKVMLKDSDNLIANVLFKQMGALYRHETGTWQNGREAMQFILSRELAMDITKVVMVDGAGGSRYNFITPQQVNGLLNKIYHDVDYAEFADDLPISGVDGSLKDRMKTPETKGRIRAKTGTETGVTALSGYVETPQQGLLSFSIMINGFASSPEKYKALEDQICAVLVFL